MMTWLEVADFAKKSGWHLGSGWFGRLFDPDEDLGSSPIVRGPGKEDFYLTSGGHTSLRTHHQTDLSPLSSLHPYLPSVGRPGSRGHLGF